MGAGPVAVFVIRQNKQTGKSHAYQYSYSFAHNNFLFRINIFISPGP